MSDSAPLCSLGVDSIKAQGRQSASNRGAIEVESVVSVILPAAHRMRFFFRVRDLVVDSSRGGTRQGASLLFSLHRFIRRLSRRFPVSQPLRDDRTPGAMAGRDDVPERMRSVSCGPCQQFAANVDE